MFKIMYGNITAKKIGLWSMNFHQFPNSYAKSLQFCPDHFHPEYITTDRFCMTPIGTYLEDFEKGWRWMDV